MGMSTIKNQIENREIGQILYLLGGSFQNFCSKEEMASAEKDLLRNIELGNVAIHTDGSVVSGFYSSHSFADATRESFMQGRKSYGALLSAASNHEDPQGILSYLRSEAQGNGGTVVLDFFDKMIDPNHQIRDSDRISGPLAVLPGLRRRGIASQLVEWSDSHFRTDSHYASCGEGKGSFELFSACGYKPFLRMGPQNSLGQYRTYMIKPSE